jgi:peptidoglycan hydrolase CwlO-like protein|tara:strand:+ start:313 stop:669 length:357 start_codon:yes stop_codon:yes gene_type:complete
MKEFILLIVFCITVLFLQNIFRWSNKEGLENCNSSENNASYKNSATIQHQQNQIDDFKNAINKKLSVLKAQIASWNISITANKNDISKNTKKIKSTVQDIQTAKEKKEKKLDEAGGGL